ncbi:hypothetical protein MO867_16405 [Microbulbifer sp. OS29]|uniref:Uncharacterized protein n=1 Tax=Microbulbifer okhotskensis TaxID=2926617 RepID=A0A9X2EU61_9GAMM|nr:hypothetical protein [Microbulbifer okhotskensis]MCO1335918.1 hypothetical protein [Microbulbifer okhotskensis]
MMQLPYLGCISAVKRLFAEYTGNEVHHLQPSGCGFGLFFVPAELAIKGNAHVQ